MTWKLYEAILHGSFTSGTKMVSVLYTVLVASSRRLFIGCCRHKEGVLTEIIPRDDVEF